MRLWLCMTAAGELPLLLPKVELMKQTLNRTTTLQNNFRKILATLTLVGNVSAKKLGKFRFHSLCSYTLPTEIFI